MLSKTVNGFAMHYSVSGDGPPVVLVPGSFTDLRFWELQIDALAPRFSVFSVSMRPYWPNARHEDSPFSASRYADDVAAFIAAIDVGPVQLVGHSLGGHIALRVAQRIPQLITSLVLAEPGGPLMPELLPAAGVSSKAPGAVMAMAAEMIGRGDIDAGLDAVIAAATRPGLWSALPDFYKQSARDNARTLIAQAVEQRPPITRDDLSSIAQPVLLIGGADSPQPFPLILDAFEANLLDVSRIAIARGTHLMNIENPLDFNAALRDFLIAHATVPA